LGKQYVVAAAVLVAHWRNRIVHPSSSKAKLRHEQKKILYENYLEIADKYRGLSVDCLLCHFEEGRPTLKDVSSLVAMTINLAREVDKSISSTLGKDDFDAWLVHLGLRDVIEKVTADTKPEKIVASIRRVFTSTAPTLLNGYEKYYLAPESSE
jgi:hypothetical protein